MESKAATPIWERSVESRGLKYTIFIGDGDSKSHKAVCEAAPYGPNVTIVKEECVEHIQKRAGTGLRKLKKEQCGEKLEDGLGLSGRGRLTEDAIDRLQAYYGIAIRSNTHNLQSMCKAIWASLMHNVADTDPARQHRFCPAGDESWCKWQKQKAGGPDYVRRHEDLPEAVFKKIKPLYLRLSDKSLLEKCLRGATQNCNESFNGLVWQICPKTGFCSATTVETAVCLATSLFNDKFMAIRHVLKEMGLSAGYYTDSALQRMDAIHALEAARKSSSEVKERRKKRRRVRKGYEEDVLEGGVTYEAGTF